MIRIGALMAANSRRTVCVNATDPCLQAGYRFQPLQPSISVRGPLGISCPSTLPRETENYFDWLAACFGTFALILTRLLLATFSVSDQTGVNKFVNCVLAQKIEKGFRATADFINYC